MSNDTAVDAKMGLQKTWTFWFFKPSTGGAGEDAESYDKQLQKLDDCDTIQDFWACFNALPSPDTLQHKHCFHLMKTGVKPEWEDSENANGGIWTFKVDKQNSYEVWQAILMAVVGEQFTCVLPATDEICGVTVKGGSANGAQLIFQVWHKDERSKNEVLEKLKTVVNRKADFSQSFYRSNQSQTQTLNKGSSTHSLQSKVREKE